MINVKNVNLNSVCWVVRPGTRYRYMHEFYNDSFIAIGHLDKYLSETSRCNIRYDSFDQMALDFEGLRDLNHNTKSQIDKFIFGMNEGDVVFTLTPSTIIPGVIKTPAYYTPETIQINEKMDEVYCVRRDVEWGEPINRSDIPLKIAKIINAYQAVFSLGDNSVEVYHWLFSYFTSGDGYYASLRIEQKDSINHHDLKELAEVIDRIQTLSIMLTDGQFESKDISLDDLRITMKKLYTHGRLNLKSQQMIMSPGDFWLNMEHSSRKSGATFLLLLACIVGGSDNIAFASGDFNSHDLLTPEQIEHSKKLITSGIDMDHVRSNLKLQNRRQNKKFVEANPNDYQDTQAPSDVSPKITGS